MFPYLTGPHAAEVEQALCSGDFRSLPGRLKELLAEEDDPGLRHLLGLMQYFGRDARSADATLEAAYHAFRERGDRRRAALVAVSLGRLHHDGIGDQPVGLGWLARGLSLVEAEEPCVEQGWVLLGLVGCNVSDTAALRESASRALRIARELHDLELECKALADGGLALVSLGRVAEGMGQLDHAMVMLRSRECPSPIVVSQVVCDLMSACERAADHARAETWLRVLEEMQILQPPDREPTFLFTHCRIAYGAVLCEIGRWTEAEVALQIGASLGAGQGRSQQVASASALADLWIQQGRIDAAAALLEGNDDRVEAMPVLARLHLARGEYDLAAAVSRQGLRMLGGDRTRAAFLLTLLVEAELRRGRTADAEAAATRIESLAAESDLPVLPALAAAARAQIAHAAGDEDSAARLLDHGIGLLAGGGWPLQRARMHLELARLHAGRDRAAAVADALAAYAIYRRLNSPAAAETAALLEQLGETVSVDAPPSGPLDVLTSRERDVFGLVALGLSNAEIARRLFITPKTAEHHVGRILGKLGLRSRAEAAAYAAAAG